MNLRSSVWLVFSLVALSLVLMTATTQPVEGGVVINNASFESTPLSSPGGYICQTSGNATCTSNLTGWTSTCNGNCGTSGTVASILFAGTNGSAFNGGIGLAGTIQNSPDGGNFVAIDGDSTYSASISQTLNGLTPGIAYVLQFYQAAAQQKGTTGATTEQWQVSLGTTTLLAQSMSDTSQGFVPWTLQSLAFIPYATSETLTFLALGSPHGGPPVVLLDGLSFTQTPEPQTYALVGLGLIAIPMLLKRRVRKSSNSSGVLADPRQHSEKTGERS